MKYNDYPIEDCVKTIEDLRKSNPGVEIYQKWTCRHCGSRQTMAEKDTFFRSGRCEECNRVTIIQACNYLVKMEL